MGLASDVEVKYYLKCLVMDTWVTLAGANTETVDNGYQCGENLYALQFTIWNNLAFFDYECGYELELNKDRLHTSMYIPPANDGSVNITDLIVAKSFDTNKRSIRIRSYRRRIAAACFDHPH